ncbi:hypothetical protein [Hydrogenophaga sp.]|uniref:hypothetical protein n=1 Tax=Hydrogenophaga sp. TaxID=1904254 RepID=UPI00356A0316
MDRLLLASLTLRDAPLLRATVFWTADFFEDFVPVDFVAATVLTTRLAFEPEATAKLFLTAVLEATGFLLLDLVAVVADKAGTACNNTAETRTPNPRLRMF